MSRETARASGHYDASPRYAPAHGRVERGWDAAAATLHDGSRVLAVDGPAILNWDAAMAGLSAALRRRGVEARLIAMGEYFAPWESIVARTSSAELADDPDFARLARADLADLFNGLPAVNGTANRLSVVYGPGAALVGHDTLWYADLAKRFAEAEIVAGRVGNLGQPAAHGPGTSRRLFYIDWPIMDRHRELMTAAVDRWIDARDPENPASLDGTSLRHTLQGLAGRPFRTKPTFKSAVWGGHWGQVALGLDRDRENTAIGYELIAPESGVLVGHDEEAEMEVPFGLLVALFPLETLGNSVLTIFGSSFPIRFDYLDTVGGGDLSVHCHPQPEYMSRVFGWPYTQHESYYVMVGGEGRRIFLGLRGDVDLVAFEAAARSAEQQGHRFEIEDFVQSFAATEHQLFMIPAGTPHGSGEGNVVLEISATPYLYSLRFYDWLRRDVEGRLRPVHVEHAFANLNPERRGERVSGELIQPVRTVRSGVGWEEEIIGGLAEVFFEVRRVVIEGEQSASCSTDGRFHVLNVVEGDGVVLETSAGQTHALNYAETIVVPAAVGSYIIRRRGRGRVRLVKALVR